MDRQNRTIVVFGATGRQGGAVARHLASEGWRVRGVSRNPAGARAQALRDVGVEMVQADMGDRSSLDRTLEGAYGVFSVQNYWMYGYGPEIRQGINVADAAHAAGIQHLVYSSVGGAERNTGVSHFESKWRIEQRIRELELPATIVRPVFFMENLLGWVHHDPENNLWTMRMPMPPDRPLQMIAVTDIGGFVALVFDDAGRFRSEALELAGDEVSMSQAARMISQHLGEPVEYAEMPMDEHRAQSPESADMFAWFIRAGYQADIAALRQMYPPLLTFGEWLDRVGFADRLRERQVDRSRA